MSKETRKFIPQVLPNQKVFLKPVLKWGPLFEKSNAEAQSSKQAMPLA